MCGKNDAKKDCLCQESGWCAPNVQNVQKETEKGPQEKEPQEKESQEKEPQEKESQEKESQEKGTKAGIVKTARVIYGTRTLVSCMEAVMRLHE